MTTKSVFFFPTLAPCAQITRPANHLEMGCRGESRLFLFSKNPPCTENPIYLFPEKELRGLSPNSYIHISVSDLFIPRTGPHIWLQQNRQTDPGNIQISHIYTSLKIGR
jgi:hypothetical protein